MMRQWTMYFWMQVKRAFRVLPAVLLTTAGFGLLAVLASLGGVKLLYQDQVAGRIAVAVVVEETDLTGRMALSMLSSMDSVDSICDFLETNEDDARAGLREGRYYAALLVPERMLESIMNGTNTPVTVLLSGQGGLETRLLQQLTESGARMLGASQAGIYAADFYCNEQGLNGLIPQVEDFLNRVYLDYALQRSSWYRRVEVSALGETDLFGYYGSTAAVLVVLLMGVPCAGFLGKESQALKNRLKAAGLPTAAQLLARILATACVLSVVSAVLMLLAAYGFNGWFNRTLTMGVTSILCAILAVLVCACVIVFCFEISSGLLAGSMVLFVLTAVMIFLSGGLLPLAFLPPFLQTVSVWIPAAAARGLLLPLFGASCDRQVLMAAGVGFALFFGMGLFGRRNVQ